MSDKALIIVDYSIDFIADNGKLTCGKPGQDIEDFITQRLQTYSDAQEEIFFMMDLHYNNDVFHPETKLFPAHNIYNTQGRDLYGKVGQLYEDIKEKHHVHYLNKTRYDSFYGTPLDSLLRERSIQDIEIVGVCTDICVLHTAISAYNLGYNITIPSKGVASFNPEGHKWALSHFQNSLGATVEE
ncbi:cysteine hydrolase family protein [Staphylococcus saccharolyticus]|uniref:cysteine hydrolase family protein n=2 Tax=Staphylococcus saccharolyticus TaxID=33028 RepID=UPI00102DB384|nr:isochorismatase family cysteine hydrolase [Staphylococcus saccharolyticus]MBL7574097.1 cysteine hydrolase [Staphylococcus saccharolyticus]MBL7585113.1 cysteine hydrolase [Staphylococcus saccharolyticus]MBL7639723.1 cysteine hydrolase [Staphylococcus saccharolyticus]QRJ68979.1 cysteine hydrolase [Staphylococcus saccharolyticus]TAA91220.1 isochorismatase [Staphylococcus saccharolyticus]